MRTATPDHHELIEFEKQAWNRFSSIFEANAAQNETGASNVTIDFHDVITTT